MSHIVQIQTQVREPITVAAACKRLGLAHRGTQFFKLGWDWPTQAVVEC